MSESHRIAFKCGPAKVVMICPMQHFTIADVLSGSECSSTVVFSTSAPADPEQAVAP